MQSIHERQTFTYFFLLNPVQLNRSISRSIQKKKNPINLDNLTFPFIDRTKRDANAPPHLHPLHTLPSPSPTPLPSFAHLSLLPTTLLTTIPSPFPSNPPPPPPPLPQPPSHKSRSYWSLLHETNCQTSISSSHNPSHTPTPNTSTNPLQ